MYKRVASVMEQSTASLSPRPYKDLALAQKQTSYLLNPRGSTIDTVVQSHDIIDESSFVENGVSQKSQANKRHASDLKPIELTQQGDSLVVDLKAFKNKHRRTATLAQV